MSRRSQYLYCHIHAASTSEVVTRRRSHPRWWPQQCIGAYDPLRPTYSGADVLRSRRFAEPMFCGGISPDGEAIGSNPTKDVLSVPVRLPPHECTATSAETAATTQTAPAVKSIGLPPHPRTSPRCTATPEEIPAVYRYTRGHLRGISCGEHFGGSGKTAFASEVVATAVQWRVRSVAADVLWSRRRVEPTLCGGISPDGEAIGPWNHLPMEPQAPTQRKTSCQCRCGCRRTNVPLQVLRPPRPRRRLLPSSQSVYRRTRGHLRGLPLHPRKSPRSTATPEDISAEFHAASTSEVVTRRRSHPRWWPQQCSGAYDPLRPTFCGADVLRSRRFAEPMFSGGMSPDGEAIGPWNHLPMEPQAPTQRKTSCQCRCGCRRTNVPLQVLRPPRPRRRLLPSSQSVYRRTRGHPRGLPLHPRTSPRCTATPEEIPAVYRRTRGHLRGLPPHSRTSPRCTAALEDIPAVYRCSRRHSAIGCQPRGHSRTRRRS